MTMNIEHDVTR